MFQGRAGGRSQVGRDEERVGGRTFTESHLDMVLTQASVLSLLRPHQTDSEGEKQVYTSP